VSLSKGAAESAASASGVPSPVGQAQNVETCAHEAAEIDRWPLTATPRSLVAEAACQLTKGQRQTGQLHCTRASLAEADCA